MKYRVNIKKTEYGFVEVESMDKIGASELAKILEQEGEVSWISTDVKVEEVVEEEEEKGV